MYVSRLFAACTLLATLHPATASAFDCLAPSTGEALTLRLEAAQAHLAAMEIDRFQASLQGAALLLPCLMDVVEPRHAATYHRLEGVLHFTNGDREAAVAALAAARRLDPEYTWTAPFAADHPLVLTWESLPTGAPRRRPVPASRHGQLLFDGGDGPCPASQATLAQHLDAQGRVVWTVRLLPGRDLPHYTWSAAPEERLWLAAGLTAGVTAGVYGAAWASHSQFVGSPPGLDETVHDRRERRTNRLAIGSAAGTAVATALVVAALRERHQRRRGL